MERPLTKQDAVKTVRITAERHKSLRQAALDRDTNLIEIADEVIAAGIKAIQSEKRVISTASSN
jgi:hypothetical protein